MATARELSLPTVLCCPACGRYAFGKLPELFVGGLKCARCEAHWWATTLQAGSVRDQLLEHFEGDVVLVDQLMNLFGLPLLIEERRFWQILLSGNEWHRYNKDAAAPGERGRSVALLRGVVSTVRRAS